MGTSSLTLTTGCRGSTGKTGLSEYCIDEPGQGSGYATSSTRGRSRHDSGNGYTSITGCYRILAVMRFSRRQSQESECGTLSGKVQRKGTWENGSGREKDGKKADQWRSQDGLNGVKRNGSSGRRVGSGSIHRRTATGAARYRSVSSLPRNRKPSIEANSSQSSKLLILKQQL